jgi:predicted DNA-binding transcriptional regulator AlpA
VSTVSGPDGARWTRAELAQMLGVSMPALQRAVDERELPEPVRARRLSFERAAVLAALVALPRVPAPWRPARVENQERARPGHQGLLVWTCNELAAVLEVPRGELPDLVARGSLPLPRRFAHRLVFVVSEVEQARCPTAAARGGRAAEPAAAPPAIELQVPAAAESWTVRCPRCGSDRVEHDAETGFQCMACGHSAMESGRRRAAKKPPTGRSREAPAARGAESAGRAARDRVAEKALVPVREKLFWSYDDLEALTGLRRRELQRMVHRGQLPQPRAQGRRRLFLASEAQAALEGLPTQ